MALRFSGRLRVSVTKSPKESSCTGLKGTSLFFRLSQFWVEEQVNPHQGGITNGALIWNCLIRAAAPCCLLTSKVLRICSSVWSSDDLTENASWKAFSIRQKAWISISRIGAAFLRPDK